MEFNYFTTGTENASVTICFRKSLQQIEGLSQNQDFFTMLLKDEEMKRQVLGIFSGEIYRSLRAEPIPDEEDSK